jgi:hypothetical protein
MGDRGANSVHGWVLTSVVTAVVLALAVAAGLYAGRDRKDCTSMGSAPSNVSVTAEGAGWSVAELCVDGRCEDADRIEVIADPGVHAFRASVVAPDGTVVEHSGEVTTFEGWPKGEGCGSRRSYGRVSIGQDGAVTTLDPWADPAGQGGSAVHREDR